MKPLEGYEVTARTDDRIVQECRFGESKNGVVRVVGNPNPPPEEHQKAVDKVYAILLQSYRRRLSNEAENEPIAKSG